MIEKSCLDKTAQCVCDFISSTLEKKNLSTLVFEITGGVDSALVAALASRVGKAVPVFFHEGSSTITSVERARLVAKSCGLTLIEINLNPAIASLAPQLPRGGGAEQRKIRNKAMYSCLKISVLDNLAKIDRGMILGAANKDEDMLLRDYFKRGSGGAVDVFPIGDLYKSEVRQLAEYLGIDRSVRECDTTLDLWGGDETLPQPDFNSTWLTTSKVAWARREVDKWLEKYDLTLEEFAATGSVLFKQMYDPIDDHFCFDPDYSVAQRDLMEWVANTEFASRHKINLTIPICVIPQRFRV